MNLSTKLLVMQRKTSFEIKYGECVALVGTNGSGKTTLVRLLAGFYNQYEGKIELAGVEGQEFHSTEQNSMISVLFQNYLKPSMSVGESIAYAPLYILDEPSASLDPKAEDEVFRMLMNMKGEHSILFITHRLASVSMADSVIYLTPNGQILQGTHEELMQSCTSYRELYQLQASKYHQKEGDKNVGDSAC